MGAPRIKVRLKPQGFLRLIARQNSTLKDFQQKAQVDPSTVSLWISGQRFPNPVMRKKIQEHTGGEWDELFEIVPEEGAR